MNFLEPRTISVIYLLQSLTLGLIFIYYSSIKKSFPGTFSLGLSLIMVALSFGFLSLQGISHDFFSIVLANSLSFTGICLVPYGFRNLFGMKNTNKKFYIAISLLNFIILFYFTIITSHPTARLVFVSVIDTIIFLETFYIIHYKSPEAISPVKKPASGVFLALGVFFLSRILVIFLNPDLFNHALNTYATANQKLFTIATLIFSVVSMVCIYTFFIIMINLILESENARSAELVRNYAKELEDINASKNKFFSIISHDLRSPIGGMAEMLKYIELNCEIRGGLAEDIKVLRQTSENTSRLLNNLLDWAKTQSKNIEYMPENINISSLIKETAKQFELMAATKNIKILKNIDESLYIRADIKMLSTILRNLFSNAIKFTGPGGSVTVSTAADRESASISLTDTGVGISPENLSRLFKIDQSAASYDSEGNAGSGLGLIICKEFTEFNKGTIKALSEPEKGTTITITFPSANNS